MQNSIFETEIWHNLGATEYTLLFLKQYWYWTTYRRTMELKDISLKLDEAGTIKMVSLKRTQNSSHITKRIGSVQLLKVTWGRQEKKLKGTISNHTMYPKNTHKNDKGKESAKDLRVLYGQCFLHCSPFHPFRCWKLEKLNS